MTSTHTSPYHRVLIGLGVALASAALPALASGAGAAAAPNDTIASAPASSGSGAPHDTGGSPDTSGPTDTTAPPDTTEHGDEGGGPNLLTFEVVWRLADGSVTTDLGDLLPDGWRGLYAVLGDSATGKGSPTSASCTYPEGTDVLLCVYANQGHGGNTSGMIVPNKPSATYTVVVNGIPEGWEVDAGTVGTFIARDSCGSPGGHEQPEPASATEEEGGGHAEFRPCTHTVVMQQLPLPPTTDGTAVPTTAADVASEAVLPATGNSTAVTLFLVGLLLAGTGLVTRRMARR